MGIRIVECGYIYSFISDKILCHVGIGGVKLGFTPHPNIMGIILGLMP